MEEANHQEVQKENELGCEVVVVDPGNQLLKSQMNVTKII